MSKSAWPSWIYDNSPIDDPLGYGERAVRFLRALKHPASTASRHAFQLDEWQERIVRRIYGPRHADGRRIVESVFLMVPRGNRKTSLSAALSLLHTIGPERVPAGQCLFAAADREQAGIGFREAANIIREDRRLVAATRINEAFNSAKRIIFKPEAVTLQAISSDGATQHGRTPSFILVDELHAWKGRDLWEALRSGLPKTKSPLMIVATTAGRGGETVAHDQYTYARKVATGEIDDPAFLPIVFEIEEGDDWQDEQLWHRVNPGLAYGYPNLDGLRTMAREAAHRPQELYAFKQYHLNEWQAQSRDPLFDMAVYDEGAIADLDLDDLAELPCFIGVDLSVNGDLTAVVIAWRHGDGRITISPTFFVPADDLAARADQDRVPYELWAKQGHVTTIPGPIIEPAVVEDHVRELCATYSVREVAFDPHLARTMMHRLLSDGIPAIEFRQGPLTMSPAIGDLERTVAGRNLRHSGHPVLRHHFDSVVASRGDTGLVRMHKATRTDRIDGAVAAAMAVSRAVNHAEQRSIYDLPDDEFHELFAA